MTSPNSDVALTSAPKERAVFVSNLGFVLAAAGCAIGLGNIWRFPYLAAKYGGGTFFLVYLILIVTLAFTLMVGEVGIGRLTGKGTLESFKSLNKRYAFIGVLATIGPLLIFPYYSVVGGWVAKYFATYLTGGGSAAAAGGPFFEAYISQPLEPVLWTIAFVLFVAFICSAGINKGLERANRILVPFLFVFAVAIAVYVAVQPGAMDGIAYFLIPDFSKLDLACVVAAASQVFFSLSLGAGCMLTYGSYLSKKEDMDKSCRRIEFFDTLVALVAGLMIIPAVFAFSGGEADAVNAGPGLLFVTLPQVFNSMPQSDLIGTLFFAMVLMAALTSALSFFEVLVTNLIDLFHWSRPKACVLVTVYVVAMAAFVSMGYGTLSFITWNGMTILDMMDFVASTILLPLVAILTCLFIGYVIKPKTLVDEVKQSSDFKREKLFVVMTKYLAPLLLTVVLIAGVLNAFGFITL